MAVCTPTKITEVGLRETLKRICQTTFDKTCYVHPNIHRVKSEVVYITRFDGKTLKLFVIRSCVTSVLIGVPKITYEVVLNWYDDDDVDTDHDEFALTSFRKAMDRLMDAEGSQVLAYLKEDLTSTNGTDHIVCMMNAILRARDADLCPACRDNMITDGNLVCHACTLGLTEEDCECHTCGVCKDGCMAPVMQTVCCKQYIHKVCWARCFPRACPFCRHVA